MLNTCTFWWKSKSFNFMCLIFLSENDLSKHSRSHLSSILLHVCYAGIPPLFLFLKVKFCCVPPPPPILIEVLMIEAVVCFADCGFVIGEFDLHLTGDLAYNAFCHHGDVQDIHYCMSTYFTAIHYAFYRLILTSKLQKCSYLVFDLPFFASWLLFFFK